ICYIETDSDETGAAEHEDSENHGDKKESSSQNQETDKKLDQSMRHRYSPAVMRLAQENNIDLDNVEGSGLGGRITRKDIQKHIENGPRKEGLSTSQSKSQTSTSSLAKEKPVTLG